MKKQITLLIIVLTLFCGTNQTQAQTTPFIGEVIMFGGNFAPRGWAFCDGQLLQIASNTALFSILGTTYGGDGRTTFGLPDLRGRAVIGPGTGPGLSPRQLGSRTGTETETLSVAQMPSHAHTATGTAQVSLSNEVGTTSDTDGQYIANHLGGFNEDATPGAKLEGVSSTTTINNTGGGQSHNNVQPSQTVNYIIALIGIYPSRS